MADKRRFEEWLNPNHGFFYTVNRTLHEGAGAYQKIELLETDEMGRVLLLDGATQVSEHKEWQYHEPMVHFPMLAHPRPERVLVIGGGDGGILREALRYSTVTHVDYVELDREVVEFCRAYLPDINGGAFDDNRVSIHFEDGRGFVERSSERYDVCIMDMTDPFGPSRMLYTREFYQAVQARLDPENGLFAMHAESPVARPVAFECIRRTLSQAFPVVRTAYAYVQMYSTLWAFAVASNGPDIHALQKASIEERISNYGLTGLKMIDGDTWHAMLTGYPYIRELAQQEVPIITDAAPDFPDALGA